MTFNKPLLAVLIGSLLTACVAEKDNSTSTQPIPTTHGKVNVLVTDNASQQYSEIWVTVLEVETQDVAGNSYTLFQNPQGQVFNLSTLAGVGQLLSSQTLPAGNYNTFEITLARSVTVIDVAGNTLNMQFAGNDDNTKLQLNGNLNVSANQISAFALDLNMDQFSVDAFGNIVPAMAYIDDTSEFTNIVLDTNAVVNRVDDDTLVITPRNSSTQMLVNLTPNAVVVGNRDLSEGDEIKVRGNVNPNNLSAQASRIDIDSDSSDSDDINSVQRVEIKGFIVSVDTNMMVVDITKSSFVPTANTITVITTDNPLFVRGSQQVMAAGQQVEIEGIMLDGLLNAQKIEIEGAGTGFDATQSVVEVKGTITAINGNIVTLNITRSNNANLLMNSTISVDSTSVNLMQANLTPLALGAYVEVKGTINLQGNFIPTVVKVEQHSLSSDDTLNESDELELTGIVASINNGLMSVDVSANNNMLLVNPMLSIDLNNTSSVRMENSASLVAGATVQVEGYLDANNIFVVTEIEAANSTSDDEQDDLSSQSRTAGLTTMRTRFGE